MPQIVHVIGRFVAKPGREDALRVVLTAAVAPTRREPGCHQYDLLQSPENPQHFCFVERWDKDESLDQHLKTDHVQILLRQSSDLIAEPPEVRRYRLL
jgi:quinol monooxygenase YgiN